MGGRLLILKTQLSLLRMLRSESQQLTFIAHLHGSHLKLWSKRGIPCVACDGKISGVRVERELKGFRGVLGGQEHTKKHYMREAGWMGGFRPQPQSFHLQLQG